MITLHYFTVGNGFPDIIFLHGWGGDHSHWQGLAESLSLYRRVVMLDLPGFGKSPEPSPLWGTREYSQAVAALIEEKLTSPVDIIGHSFGGKVALHLSAQYPQLVNRLILIGAPVLRVRRSTGVYLKIILAKCIRYFSQVGVKRGKLESCSLSGGWRNWCQKMIERLGSADWRRASPIMRQILSRVVNEDLVAELPKIRSPILLIWGEKDRETPLKIGKKLKRLLPNTRLVVIPNAAHFPHWEKRGEVLSAIWKFLDLPSAW